MAQTDFRYIFGLNFVNAKADHEVRHNFAFFLGLTHNAHGFIDVE